MANPNKRVPENVPGDFFVDTTCIDCDTCRQLALSVFGEAEDYAFVKRQPVSVDERRAALRALLACPTGSIGCLGEDDPKSAMDDFPLRLGDGVYYCGFNSPKSFGGNSYLFHNDQGNWLVDSPKYLPQLARQFEKLGGIANIFLTHSDDVADADRYARHFGSRRFIHREELASQPDAEEILDGTNPLPLADGVLAIPTPGHTAGHCVLLLNDRFLFTGDHLFWDRADQHLAASRDYCWHSWPLQIESMRRLAQHDFEWVLPGHGQRVHMPRDEMRRHMKLLVAAMEDRT
jgi:glyoxylase-like metal-dependent hydrolase (beta-lactamase superfamily II)/ferredoxin